MKMLLIMRSKRRIRTSTFLAARILFVALIILPPWSAHGAADKPQSVSRDMALSAMSDFRMKAVVKPELMTGSLGLMPITANGKDEGLAKILSMSWTQFFRNSIVKVGCLPSDQPVALYYNPIYDIGVLTLWKNKENRRFDLVSMQALSGECISDLKCQAVPLVPAWATTKDKLFTQSIKNTTAQRLSAFAAQFPIDRAEPASLSLLGTVSMETLQLDAENRLITQTAFILTMDKQFSGTIKAFLAGLKEGNIAALQKVGFGMDKGIADELVRLPPPFRKAIDLAAVLPLGKDELLVFFSIPADPTWAFMMFLDRQGGDVGVKKLAIIELK